MKATLAIVQLEFPTARIKVLGGAGQGTIGHAFDLLPTVNVDKRTMGALSGEGVDVPQLEWNERIDWYSAPPVMGARGATVVPNVWKFVGTNEKNMYAENPTSNTFKAWHEAKFFWATASPPNTPPPGLAACKNSGSMVEIDKAAKHWVAQNGFRWKIPELTDRPAMGLAGGSGGGGGASLVTGNTRRRVIHFDLGFRGCPTRVKFVQILESVSGVATIHKLVNQALTKAQVEDASNLTRWRGQVNAPGNTTL